MKWTKTFGAAVAMTVAGSASADLIIYEVVDGDLAGGNPKYVSIFNNGIADYTFAAGGIIVQSNANTDRDVDVDLTGVTVKAGQGLTIQSTANNGETVFESVYGGPAGFYSGAFFGNGDDRYAITDMTDGSNILDIFGAIDVDGTGQDWEYTDGYARRLNPTTASANGGVFDISEWTVSLRGLDGLDEASHAAVTDPFVVPEPASLALLGLGGLTLLRRRTA